MLHVFGANSISIEVYPDARINRLIVSQLLQSTVKLLHICLLKTVALNVVVATLTLQRSVLAELGLLLALYSFIRVCNEFFEPSASHKAGFRHHTLNRNSLPRMLQLHRPVNEVSVQVSHSSEKKNRPRWSIIR